MKLDFGFQALKWAWKLRCPREHEGFVAVICYSTGHVTKVLGSKWGWTFSISSGLAVWGRLPGIKLRQARFQRGGFALLTAWVREARQWTGISLP